MHRLDRARESVSITNDMEDSEAIEDQQRIHEAGLFCFKKEKSDSDVASVSPN